MSTENNKIPRICMPTEGYETHYPRFLEYADIQLEEKLWFATEMEVELDRMQLLYELSPEQKHLVEYVIGLFLRYELVVGKEFWREVVVKTFPRPEVEVMASVFSMIELAVHARAYNKLNEVLGKNTDEHYLAYEQDKELKSRVDWLNKVLNGRDKILATAIFTMTETALLFSLFSLLKSFQSNGLNKLPVVVRLTNQSALDEDHHGMGGAELINTYYAELGTPLVEDTERYTKIREAVRHVYEHECRIIDKAMLTDSINGVSKQEFKEYVKHRLNVYLERIQLPKEFVVGECQIISWFETNTYAYKMIDFFTAGVGNEYESGWNEINFGKCWMENNDN